MEQRENMDIISGRGERGKREEEAMHGTRCQTDTSTLPAATV